MHILFLVNHPRWINGLPNGFIDSGHDVVVLEALNEKSIITILLDFKPNLIISIGWMPKNDITMIQKIRKYIKLSNIPYIYWATEDPGYTHQFTLPLIQKTNPDFVFTICNEKVEYYNKLGFKSDVLDFGYHESIQYRVKCEKKYKIPIAVVANAYPKFLEAHTESFRLKSMQTLISPILESNIPINFWGNDWNNMNSILKCSIPDEYIRGYIPYNEANKIYSSADIVIGIQNQKKRPQLCQRTYEILGSEGFLLTSDVPKIRELFIPGQDLIVSASSTETIQLIKYYLNNSEEREKIRINGKKAVAKHSYKYRAEYIIDRLRKANIINNNVK